MSKRLFKVLSLGTASLVLLWACAQTPPKEQTTDGATPTLSEADKSLHTQATALFKALPATMPGAEQDTPAKVALGKQLFHEPRLSKSGALSCNSCHNLASWGVDNRPTSIGHGFKTGERNSPTVLNAGLHTAQFWDLRAKDLAEQAKGPILNPVEMAMPDEATVIKRLASIPDYVESFRKAFPNVEQALSYENTVQAIAAFERTLLTPSRFDAFLTGDGSALSAEEKKGLQTFMSKGCTACHSGPAIGGALAQKFGVVKPYKHAQDLGRFTQTQAEADKFVFKVPSLRNIEKTYPYFHDGKVWSLEEAVTTMAETQLGQPLTPQETSEIVTFLKTLTGTLPEDALKLPILPASGPDTPQPQI